MQQRFDTTLIVDGQGTARIEGTVAVPPGRHWAIVLVDDPTLRAAETWEAFIERPSVRSLGAISRDIPTVSVSTTGSFRSPAAGGLFASTSVARGRPLVSLLGACAPDAEEKRRQPSLEGVASSAAAVATEANSKFKMRNCFIALSFPLFGLKAGCRSPAFVLQDTQALFQIRAAQRLAV